MNKAVFLFGCIGVRLLLSFLVKISPVDNLPFYSVISILPALGFISIYLLNLKMEILEELEVEFGGIKCNIVYGCNALYMHLKRKFLQENIIYRCNTWVNFWLNHHYLNIV